MKKLIITAAMLCLFCGASAHAASGDIAGNIYYTDIKTYIYHAPITSYNIGGKTVIDAEILNWHYGFDVYWYEDTRHLEITDKGGEFNSLQAMNGELVESNEGKVGDISGQYYETDIITTLNGSEIEAYNIGGRTFFVAEAMRDFGYTVDWNEEARTLTVSKDAGFYEIETDYGTIKSEYPDTYPTQFSHHNRGIILRNGEGGAYTLPVDSGVLVSEGSVSYVKLKDIEKCLSADIKLNEELKTGHTEWAGGMKYDEDYYNYSISLDFDTSSAPQPKTVDIIPDGSEEVDFGTAYEVFADLIVNGEIFEFIEQKYQINYFRPLIIDGEIFIPTRAVAQILGYDFGY